MEQGVRVKFGEWISEAWNMLIAQWQTWVLISFVFFGISFLASSILSGIQLIFQPKSVFYDFSSSEEFFKMFSASFGWIMIRAFILAAVHSLMTGGMYHAAFKQLRGEPIGVGDMFSRIDLAPKIFLAVVLIGVIGFIGAVFCVIPGILAFGMLYMTLPIIVRTNADPVDAIRESFKTTRDDWLMFTLLALVTHVLAAFGVLACCIGLLFTYPLIFLISAVAYRDCFEPDSKPLSRVDELYSKHCKNCGKSIPTNANFCEYCGANQV
jgi:hypothetical protein